MAFIQTFEKTAGFAEIAGKGIEFVQKALKPQNLPPVKRPKKLLALADKAIAKKMRTA